MNTQEQNQTRDEQGPTSTMTFDEYKQDRQFQASDMVVAARTSKDKQVFHCLSIGGQIHTFIKKDLMDTNPDNSTESLARTREKVVTAIRSGNASVLKFIHDTVNELNGEIKRTINHLLCGGGNTVALDL
jgi:uncharacterized protein with HEPN domain